MFQLDGFEIIEKIGEGGMATVWKARQRSLDRFVAIKELSSRFASTTEDIERFQTEARTMGKLRHPGIVQVYDAYFQSGVYVFVMELIEGYSIGELIQEQGKTAEKEALTIGTCVAEALDYAWTRFGMIHCDIKPDNVLVDSDGAVKVTDLGLSRTVKSLWSGGQVEADTEVFGTPAYMAPEQAMGDPTLDCRADMYSLGAMMYHMATGKMLFDSAPQERVMEMQVTAQDENPKVLEPKLTTPFCELIEKLLSKDRAYRYKDWQEVLTDIDCVRKRHPLASGHPQPNISTIRSIPRKQASTAASSRGASSVLVATTRPEPKNKLQTMVMFGFFGLLVVIGLIVGVSESNKRKTLRMQEQRQARLAEAYLRQAEELANSDITRFEEIASLYQKAIQAAPRSQAAQTAKDQLPWRKKELLKKCDQVLADLNRQADGLLSNHKYADAISLFSRYNGPCADMLKKQRNLRVNDIRIMQIEFAQDAEKREETQRIAEQKKNYEEKAAVREGEMRVSLLSALAIPRTGLEMAKTRLDAFEAEDPKLLERSGIVDLVSFVNDALKANQSVLDSLIAQKGQTVPLSTKSGAKTSFKILNVDKNGELQLRRPAGASWIDLKIDLYDLSLGEILSRTGGTGSDGEQFVRALLCIKYGNFHMAREEASPLPDTFRVIIERRIPPQK